MGKKVRTGAGGIVDNVLNQQLRRAEQAAAGVVGGVVREGERAVTDAVTGAVSGAQSGLSGLFNIVQSALSGNPLSNLPERVDLTKSPDLKEFVNKALTILNHAPRDDQGIIEGLKRVIAPSMAGVEEVTDLKNVSRETLALLYDHLESKRDQSRSPQVRNQITTLLGGLDPAVERAQPWAGLARSAPTPAVQQQQRPALDFGGGGGVNSSTIPQLFWQ